MLLLHWIRQLQFSLCIDNSDVSCDYRLLDLVEDGIHPYSCIDNSDCLTCKIWLRTGFDYFKVFPGRLIKDLTNWDGIHF